jgi:hypothetical protein
MKTMTEFSSTLVKKAAETLEALKASGKTPEELPGAWGEAMALESPKRDWLFTALECVGAKTMDLKRAVVASVTAGEKLPGGWIVKGEQAYCIEYYPPVKKAAAVIVNPTSSQGAGPARGKKAGTRGKKGPGKPAFAGTPPTTRRPPPALAAAASASPGGRPAGSPAANRRKSHPASVHRITPAGGEGAGGLAPSQPKVIVVAPRPGQTGRA